MSVCSSTKSKQDVPAGKREKRSRGRPSAYRPEYCQQVVDFCAEGFTLTAFAAKVDVARSTIEEWKAQHPEFLIACARAQAQSQAYWEARIKRELGNREFNANAALTMMKARFTEFREPSKIEVSGPGGGPIKWENISDDTLRTAFASISSGNKS